LGNAFLSELLKQVDNYVKSALCTPLIYIAE
jgi:hypothetical protein